MSDINQIVLSSLLNSISSSNLNNRTSLNTKSNTFDSILGNTLLNLNSTNQTCTCNQDNSLNSLDMLNTILSSINNIKTDNSIKTDIQKTSNEITISNTPKPSGKMENAINLLEDQVGKPYVWGATGPEAFDCSGLVRYVYKTALGKEIPRVSYDQSKFGQEVDKKDLQVGDLIFFDTMKKGRVSHVGMYIGNNEFIHASSPKNGVKKSELSGYYEEAYRGARRP